MNIVTFTLHRRPFYTRQVLEAWAKVRGIQAWEFQFNIDPSDQWAAQSQLANSFLSGNGLSGSVHVNEYRLGVLKNPKKSLEQAFRSGANYAVLAEEDVVPSSDALEYFRFALSSFDIACAHTPEENGAENGYRLRYWFNPWLWGCTSWMWETHLRDTWDEDYKSADTRGPGGWDCNIGCRLVHDRDFRVVFPTASRSKNIGKYMGVHQGVEEWGQSSQEPESFRAEREPVEQWAFMTGDL